MVAPHVASAIHALASSAGARETPVTADKPQPAARDLRLVSNR